MTRRSLNLAFILVLLMVAGGLRHWPVQSASATVGPGFEWTMLPRHLGKSLVDPNNLAAAQSYVNPANGYGVSFDGCETVTDGFEQVTHTYTITGSALPAPRVVSMSAGPRVLPPKLGGGLEELSCGDLIATTHLPQGNYDVSLQVSTASEGDITYPPTSILVKDILIISVGDSYGSGEGAPDREVQYGLLGFPVAPAFWQDQNCHRSAWAGASQAAVILENADPHTSVTFISLACSGATINTPIDDNPDDGTINMAKFQGAGLLAPYSGIEPKGNFNPSTFLPPQMEQAARIANGRAIDALTVSGGGNDMHFATVIADCVTSDCSTNQTTLNRLDADFTQLPNRYQELADFINGDRDRNGAPALNITPDRVYITEYPNPTRNNNGEWCDTNQIDDPLLSLPGTGITKDEMSWASENVVNRLNLLIKTEAAEHGWNVVTGISAEFFDGHGWCVLGTDANGAPKNWINRSTDALAIQGPVTIPIGLIITVGAAGIVFSALTGGLSLLLTLVSLPALLLELKGTDGTMHPNRMGQMAYARHIASSIQTKLSGRPSVPTDSVAPTIETPQPVTAQTLDRTGAIVHYPVPVTHDDADGAGVATCSPPSGSLFPVGTTRITCIAQDASGNQATPVSFLVTVVPVTGTLPDPTSAQTSLRSGCTNADSDSQGLENEAGPVSFSGTNVSGQADVGALKARASATDDDCAMRVSSGATLTVGAGSTGLADGDPVLLSVTLGLDGTLTASADANQVAIADMSANYSIVETNCPDPVPDLEFGGEGGGYCPQLVAFNSSIDMDMYGGATDQWYVRAGWSLRNNVSLEQSDDSDLYCDDGCTDPVNVPFDTGTHAVIFASHVGAVLQVEAVLDTFATGYLGATAISDFANTFSLGVLEPTPGFEGLSIIYGAPPETNQPPAVGAGGPYSIYEGGSVTVSASGSDPDGDALSYAWDLDGDGTFETDGANPTFSAAGLDGPTTRTITVQVSDGRLTSTNQADVEILNAEPAVVISGALATSQEGATTNLTSTTTDPGINDTHIYSWSVMKNGSPWASGTSPTLSFIADDNATYVITLTVTDDDGGVGTDSKTTAVSNIAPTATLDAPAVAVSEGDSFNIALIGPADPSSADVADGFMYAFDCGSGQGEKGSSNTATCTAIDNPSQLIKGTIIDKDGSSNQYTGSVLVNNVTPALSPLSAPVAPVAITSAVNVSATFTDPGVLDTHTALIEWGDGTSSAGSITEANGSGSVTGSHTYSAAGVYTITATLTDKDGGVDSETFQYVVVYDPSAGFVTGGGWIASPAGAYATDPSVTGKASFGFVSKYQKGAKVPSGNTQFQFQAGNLNFTSTAYEWLVIAGPKAQFKGSGTINGSGSYGFLLSANDGQVAGGGGADTFRIKIWDTATGDIVYDNQMGASDDAAASTALGGGSIVIHGPKK